MEKEKQIRNYMFDNIKAMMLFLVVVGHVLDPYAGDESTVYRRIMEYIYLFHMPMFAFVTGYFTKDLDKARNNAVKKSLIPYLFWQLLYITVALIFIALKLTSFNTDVFKPSLLLPSSPLYYLIAVFFWKILIKDILKLRMPIFFSVIIGVLISTITSTDYHIGRGATYSLLYFFVLGVLCTKEDIQKIRSKSKYCAIIIMLIGIIPASVFPYSFRNVRFTYHSVGLENGNGILYRLIFYIIATFMIFAIINLMPERKTLFSKIGTNAIMVYAGSSFAAPSLFLLIAKYIPSIAEAGIVNFISILIFAFFIVIVCSQNWIINCYHKIMQGIEKVLFKDDDIYTEL